MSHSETITVTCPKCKNKQPFTVWQSVNVTLEPALKQKLLDRSLITLKCEKCGHEVGVEQELMYHDMDRKLMILRGKEDPEDTLTEALGAIAATVQAEYTFRFVDSINELIEKVLISDAGLDDRVVEVVKSLLLERIDESQRGEDAQLFFGEAYTEKSEKMVEFLLVNESGSTSWAVPFEQTIGKCEAELQNILPDRDSERGKWLRVDQQYASKYVGE